MTSQWVTTLLETIAGNITMGNYNAMEIHCEVTMSNDVRCYMCITIMHNDNYYEPLLLRITTLTYDIAVSLLNSLNCTHKPLKSILNQ